MLTSNTPHPSVSNRNRVIRWSRALRTWIISLTLCTGCVVPMPVELDDTEENFAPSYDPTWITPTPAQVIDYDPQLSGERSILFDVGAVTDPNQADTLFWRVFLNYQGRFYNAIYRSNRGGGLSPSQRTEGISFALSPCLDFKLFNFEGPYRVELIVTDRPFISDSGESAFINQLIAEDAQSFRVHWFIRFPQELCLL